MAPSDSSRSNNSRIITNEAIKNYNFLEWMYQDGYFPDFLVDKVKAILIDLCEKIEVEKPQDEAALLVLTHTATESINALESEFHDHESELETVARDCMGGDFAFVVRAYGFTEVDIEEVIAPRDW